MPSKTKDTQPMSEDAIRQRAYLMWEADGRPDGMADHYWMKAAAPDEAVHDAVAETARKVGKAVKAKADSAPKPETKANKAAPAKPAAAKTATAKSATAEPAAAKTRAAAAKVSAPPVKAKAASKPPSKKAAKKD